MNSTVIKPTIGRRVWFRPSAAFLASNPILTQFNPEQPMDAGIVYVHHDHMVNLIVTDHVGKTLAVPSVPLLAGHYVADEDTDVYCCCEWMPYQKSQAAKTEVADKGIVLEPKYREPTQREQLEYALVSGAASALAISPGNARQVVDGINVVLDTLHPLPTLSNPHTGTPRDPRDVASDPQAVLCVKPGEPLKSAAMASGIVIPPIGAPSAGTTAASLPLPVVDPGPDALEREIQAKADKGPRVTPAALQAEIVSAHFFTAYQGAKAELQSDGVAANAYEEIGMQPLKLLTFCVLVLRNGFTVYGASACASPENFNAEIGRRIARENAEREIWPLLGFRLRDELTRPALTDGDVAADAAGTCRPDNHTSACTACKRA